MTALVKRTVSVTFTADVKHLLCGPAAAGVNAARKQKQRDKRKPTKCHHNTRQMLRLCRPILLLFFILQVVQHLPRVNMLTDDSASSANQLSFVESPTKLVNNSAASAGVSVNSVNPTLSVNNEIVQNDVAATMLPAATAQPAKRKLRRKYPVKMQNRTALASPAGQRYKGKRRKVLLQRMQPNATHATRNMLAVGAQQPQLQRITAESIPKNVRRQQAQQEKQKQLQRKQQQRPQHQKFVDEAKRREEAALPQQQRLHQTQQQQQFSYNPREGQYHHQQQQQQQQQPLPAHLPQSENRQRELQSQHFLSQPPLQPDTPATTLRQQQPEELQHHYVGNSSSITSRQHYNHQQQQQPQPQPPQHTVYDTTTIQNRQDHVVIQGNTDIVVYRNIGTLPCPPGVRLVPHRFIPVHTQQRPRPRGKSQTNHKQALFTSTIIASS
ncbi:PREDICTED: putative cyclin-dependent serine/threonine-protein kinase DDB_G0272797/DDB_G0274007, partial [Rhagoletis zephyria]|uniref:putative cyclin-dependent serine/threonine-protein kinase DDB_G0272797/DDB_G0274007 n=1 Tax=Rhagoletis zephyria TaxID=28612 RepID=UPI0008112A34